MNSIYPKLLQELKKRKISLEIFSDFLALLSFEPISRSLSQRNISLAEYLKYLEHQQ